MTAAIVAAIIAALLVALAIVVGVHLYNGYSSTHTKSNHRFVNTVSSVGVSSSMPTQGASHAVGTTEGGMPGKNPADGLKVRFNVMAAATAAVFGALGIKLFSMQVLDSSSYKSAADDNRYATVSTPAPRGFICDRSGIPLVKNRSSLTVLADADVADDQDVLGRLSVVLGIPRNVVRMRIQDSTSGAQSKRTVASDVRLRDVAFIREHSDAFPGVTVETRSVRDYPYGALAAHALGYTGSVGESDLSGVSQGRDLQLGDDVGKSGVESAYDDLLAGDHGQRVVVADADGNVRSVKSETQPVRGSSVYTTICGPAQYVAERALADLIAPEDDTIGTGKGVAGCVVAMNVKDGSIAVLANFPTFSPANFVGGISQSIWDMYNTSESQYPLLNRAIAGTYPAASTMKAFSGLAGLKYGFATEESTWECGGSWDGFNSGDVQKCWLRTGHGTETFHDSIVDSCDITFYEIAKDFWDAGQAGKISETALQDEIKRYHFGSTSGIDITGEAAGRIPTPEWKKDFFKDTPEEASWRGGDMTNMAIGQGYVLVTPLQIAVAYGAVATGKIMQPHLLQDIRNEQGDIVVTHKAQEVDEPVVDAKNLKLMREALHGVVNENSDMYERFAQYGIDAAGKTGTAEVAGKDDYAVFVCYAPYDDPKYVVSVLIEQGGGGSAVASPVGAEVMNALLQADAGELTSADMGHINGSTGKYVERELTNEGRTD